MITVQIELPERLADDARAAGLLAPEAIQQLIAQALQSRAVDRLLEVADRVETAGVKPMTPEEINAEIKAYRAERRGAKR